MGQRQTSAQKSRVQRCDTRVPHQGLLTAAQVMFNLQTAPAWWAAILSSVKPQTLSAVLKGCQDVQKAAQQHQVCADLLWPTEAFLSDHQQKHWIQMEIWDKGEIKAMLVRLKNKTTKARKQYCTEGTHRNPRFGSRLWLGQPSGSLWGTSPATSQPCFPTQRQQWAASPQLCATKSLLSHRMSTANAVHN